MKHSILPYFFSLLILFSACIKKDDFNIKHVTLEDDLSSDWVIPLVKTKLTLGDFVPDSLSYLTVDSNGLYALHYQGKLFEAVAKDYVTIPNQSFNTGTIILTTPLSLPSFSATVNDTYANSFTYSNSNGSQIHHLHIKTCNLTLAFSTTLQHSITANIVFPTITKAGIALSFPITITYPNTSANAAIDLSGYIADFTNNNTTYNTLPYTIAYTVTGSGQPITTTEGISVQVNLSNMNFSFADGYLGNFNIPINKDSINLDIFKNAEASTIYVEDPQIHFTVNNWFGVSASGNFPNINVVSKSGIINPLTGSFFTNPITINGPSTLGQFITNDYYINKTNSNLQTIFSPVPIRLIYEGNIEVNPASTPTYNFVTDTSKIQLLGDVILPLWFKAEEFILRDTFGLSALPKDTNIVESIEIKTKLTNAMGVQSNLQIYFTDSNYTILDSLYTDNNDFLPAAQVDAVTGYVIQSATSEKIATITYTKYKIIAPRMRYAVAKATLKTSGTNAVKIRNVDYIGLQLAARAKFKLKVKL